MPSISIFFLSKGAKFHKNIKSQIGTYGVVPNQKLWSNDRVSILSFNSASTQSKSYIDLIGNKIQDDKIRFVSIMKDSTDYLSSQNEVVILDSGSADSLTFSNEYPTIDFSNHFILVDTTSHVRNFYDINDSVQVNRLVLHALKIRPPKTKAKLKNKPVKEK